LDSLQESGYRLTAPRRVVIQILAETEFALNPAQIFNEARQLDPRIGLVTIYRTLEKLEQLALVQRVHNVEGCHAYIAAPDGHQHLIICRECSRAEYVDGNENLEPMINDMGTRHGYLINDHWLQLFGLCPVCLAVKETK
jgi:Fe2+ or Zn2+ uptake regulation protein